MKGERCCSKCRALPGACALKRRCPCHPRHDDYVPPGRDDVEPARPARPSDRPMFVRPAIPARPSPPRTP